MEWNYIRGGWAILYLDGCNLGGSGRGTPVVLLIARVPKDVLALLPSPHRRLHRVTEVVLPIFITLDVLPVELILASSGAPTRRVATHRSRASCRVCPRAYVPV